MLLLQPVGNQTTVLLAHSILLSKGINDYLNAYIAHVKRFTVS